MGRTEAPEVAAIFDLAREGVDLRKAYNRITARLTSKPSWGNVQRRWNSMLKAAPATPAAAPAAAAASRSAERTTAASSSGAASRGGKRTGCTRYGIRGTVYGVRCVRGTVSGVGA